ncbi:MAG: alpha/beta hydrolase [Candidatus Hydrothermarchaeota archaeon]|nr:MAG: alpha/beta hydrolase [Candidatus Hydrothermarchaeota archaeon]
MHGEDYLRLNEKVTIYYRFWKAYKPKDVIVGVHGLAEHGGRYGHIGRFFASKGYSFYIADNRGHGKSSGERGYIDKFYDFIEDLDNFITKVLSWEKREQIILFGHSMGGLIALYYTLKFPEKVKAIIVSGPSLLPGESLKSWTITILKIISIIYPKYKPNIRVDPTLLTHDEEVVKEYVEDPLVFKEFTIRLGVEILKAGEYVLKNAHKIKKPILILHGSEDKIVSPDSSRIFFEKCGSEIKELKIYDGLYHEILNEENKEEILNYIVNWLDKTISEI